MPEENGQWVTCPNCGSRVNTGRANRSGRKPLNISVKNVCDALKECQGIAQAAQKLGCSRGFIYKVLREHGMTPKSLTKGVYSVKNYELK